MARLDDLRWQREGLIARMKECSSDQNYAVMGRLLIDVLKQIEELDPASKPKPEATKGGGGVVVDFAARLANGTGAGS